MAGPHGFPAEVRLPPSQYQRYYKGGLYRCTTILVYECTYTETGTLLPNTKSGKVTQYGNCHAEEIMLGNLAVYNGRVQRLKMWINNSPCNIDGHKCAEKLVAFTESNPGMQLIIYCVYKYGGKTNADRNNSNGGLKQLMRKRARISFIPPKDRQYILNTSMPLEEDRSGWQQQMNEDADKFNKEIGKLQDEIGEEDRLLASLAQLRL